MNTMKTFMLMAALTALFMVAGRAMGGQQGMIIALLLAVGLNFFAYWNSDKMALSMNRAREVSVHEAPDLHALVANLASRAGLPKPKVYVVDDPTPNAFATGRDPEHAAVAVTTGIMQVLDRYELEGVIAHELGHIKNRDILIGSIAAVMAGAISYLASMAQWAMLFGGMRGNDEEGGSNPLVMLVSMIVAPIAATLIQMAISRSREYLADATGAEICGHPKSLASALNKLANYNAQRPMNVNPASAQMYIVNPLSGGSIASLFSTHPPMDERIRRLLSM
ncbi:zinc metalloprotease HtpX [Desulfobulbus rhabdoformis]|uniref:zinc metalloprotease HtpX n=1 Tax=Desulfobulbus rhabdoformis TaxID=34032 RepID=UPI001962705C|nr:zinc metalloprotease HtpX [Desulfobulbus rhabdoformis]MBM9616088.1 zinc metalloprotease HtpX [Desulfobulbus rhabdoformis]